MLVVLLPKLWFWIENRDWHNCFWMSLWLFVGWTLTGPKKASKSTILHNKLNKEKKNKKTPGRCCQSGYLLLWWLWCIIGGLGTLRKCYVSSPVAKAFVLDWKSWLAQLFLDVFLGLTLTGPKKASKSTILYNRLNKEKTPGQSCQSRYLLPWWLWCTIGSLGTLRKCYVSNPVAKTLVWIENHDWHNCFWMSYWTQKSFKISNFKEKTAPRTQTNANTAFPAWAYLMLHTRQVSTKMSMSHHVFPTPS